MEIEKIIYVADPMCSWCWGFAPEIKRLRDHLHKDIRFSLIMGGLREGHRWDEEFKNYLQQSWQKVHEITEQPFTPSFLTQEQFDYNTEPACRAVVAVRQIDEQLAFDALFALQKAFYADGKDITRISVITEVVDTLNIDGFEAVFNTSEPRMQTQTDKNRARLYGAASFPSLITIDTQGHLSVIRGYRTFEELSKLLAI